MEKENELKQFKVIQGCFSKHLFLFLEAFFDLLKRRTEDQER